MATPGGGTTGAPLQPTQPRGGTAVPPLPNFNPAARDVALRNLGTQTPAAPTAPAAAPAPAAATPSASSADAAGATSGPIPVDIPPPHPAGQSYVPSNPGGGIPAGLQTFIDAIHNAPDQAARQEAIQNLIAQQQSAFGIPAVGSGEAVGGPDFANHWDQFEQQAEQAAKDAEAQHPPHMTEDGQGNMQVEAARNRRIRMSRMNAA